MLAFNEASKLQVHCFSICKFLTSPQTELFAEAATVAAPVVNFFLFSFQSLSGQYTDAIPLCCEISLLRKMHMEGCQSSLQPSSPFPPLSNIVLKWSRLMGPPEENLIFGSDPAVLSSPVPISIQYLHTSHRSMDNSPAI
jgi:hypothetical protein